MLPPFEGISRKFCSFIPLVRTESCSTDSCKVYSETFGFFFFPPGSYVPPKVKGSNCGGERRGFETLPHHKHETLHSSMLLTHPRLCFPKDPKVANCGCSSSSGSVFQGPSGRQGSTCGPPSLSTQAQGARHFPSHLVPAW